MRTQHTIQSQEKTSDLLARLETKTEEHLSIAIQTFQNLNNAKLLQPSARGGWSIAQCLDHLNRYGNFYLPQIKLAINRHQDAPAGFFRSGWLGRYFTNTMDPRTGKTYKAFKEYIPETELNAQAVVAEFIHQKEVLLHYLVIAAKADLDTRVPISISRMIKLKLGDVLQFLVMHHERHVLQAKRNLVP